jgi:hypothetical protein
MKIKALIVLACLVSFASGVRAEPLSPDQVPEPLRPWTGWVLRGHEDQFCPVVQGPMEEHRCVWPSRLILTIDEASGRFTQDFRVYRDTFVMLPGNSTRWPLDVRVDGKSAPAILHNGVPSVFMKAGNHTVEGSFAWDHMPQILSVPAETALVSLTVDGKSVDFPNREPSGQLWLKSATVQSAPEGLEVEVERRVVDEVPLLLVTRIELNVSGKDREITLGKALPDGFVPMALNSPLPARIEPDGHLRVQLRPGTWTLELTARHEGPAAALSMPATDAPWATQEIWAFEAHNDLRLVSIEGVGAVDPTQTRLPLEWRQFPTFLMQPGTVMRLVEKRRGDSDPAPDQLTLDRALWLDFGGGGYTVHDSISGTMSKSWRLDMMPPQQLGRVAVAGIDQVITRNGTRPLIGVEIRQGQLQMEADSRIENASAHLPSVGWDHDFQSVSAMLNLPPGWRLFRASGVDDVSSSWITDWTLLELFLVLVTAMAIFRMWGPAWGGVALLTLALTYPETGAPKLIWLAILVGEALDRVLPKGRGRWVIQAYRLAVAAIFVVITIPFMVDQVRTAIYPALAFERTLEFPVSIWGSSGEENPGAGNIGEPHGGAAGNALSSPESPPPPAPLAVGRLGGLMQMERASNNMGEGAIGGSVPAPVPEMASKTASAFNYSYASVNPNSVITTGPGLPNWEWVSVRFGWRGPVQSGQQISLWLLSPTVNFLLGFLRVGLIALLAFRVFISVRTMSRPPGFGASTVAAFLAILLFAPMVTRPAHADFPSDAMLNELQRRLLENRDCSPNCASIPRIRIEVAPASLVARIEIDAAAETAIPLPGSVTGFNPARITLDGKDADAIARTQDGLLWLLIPAGKHQALLEGALPQADSIEIPLPLKPYRLEAASEGWTVVGIHEDGVPEDTLRLVRQAAGGQNGNASLQPGELPPFMRVTRVIHIGLQWDVATTVERMTPNDAAITLQVPLLPGESVTTPGLHVENDKVVVSMPSSTGLVEWRSTLKIAPSIELKAADSTPWTEVWQILADPMWHVEPSGIPEVYQVAQQYPGRIRQWQPWPGEVVRLLITRPAGVSGPTLTIDSSRLEMNPGLRASDVAVTFVARSSRGGQKIFVLPAQAELQSLTIDGVDQPIRQERQTLTIPIVPGRQTIAISWREPRGISWRAITPKFSLGAPSVNAETVINMPADRWTLLVSPALLGPAVLFWGLLLVFALVAFALGRADLTPLRATQWFLLSLGLTQVPIWAAAVVAGWLLALGWRKQRGPSLGGRAFRMLQVALGLLSVFALAMLFSSIEAGLLGLPQMQISGNGSSADHLQWFHDRTADALPRMWAVSLPLMAYRVAMLLWALWLASALLKWLSWGWTCFSEGGLWRSTGAAQTPPSPVESA